MVVPWVADMHVDRMQFAHETALCVSGGTPTFGVGMSRSWQQVDVGFYRRRRRD